MQKMKIDKKDCEFQTGYICAAKFLHESKFHVQLTTSLTLKQRLWQAWNQNDQVVICYFEEIQVPLTQKEDYTPF